MQTAPYTSGITKKSDLNEIFQNFCAQDKRFNLSTHTKTIISDASLGWKKHKMAEKIMVHDGKFLQLKHLNPNAKGNENSGRNTCFQSSVKIICKTAFPLESNLVNSVVVLKKEEFNSLDENRSNISWKQRFTIEPTFRISSYVPQITL